VEEFLFDSVFTFFDRFINSGRTYGPCCRPGFLPLISVLGRISMTVFREYLPNLKSQCNQTFVDCSPPGPLPDDEVT